jgi:aspartyl-tRNA(Asn)/glutamyl-tRNA(Gln) amidotransferase subunit B
MSSDAHPRYESRYESVIGLEVHVHLRTRAKLFCSCAVSYGDDPNHHTCPVCLALPGALPVLNGVAVEHAIRTGLATHCEVHSRSIFARKNYFYPDLPKGYQISQYENPLATGGWIEIEVEGQESKRIGITRIHMEEDAGKSIHDGAATETHVDLNRTSVPLIEIVSEPDLRSSEEAGAYLRTLRAILRYIESSDADLEKGQFRCDANVSLRLRGSTEFGTRTEIKNINSFRFVEDAIRAEIDRQAEVLDEGGEIQQATLGYDAEANRLFVMRVKENADDYRYFPDPDLIPLMVGEEWIEEIRAALPELPDQKRSRFESEYGLSAQEAGLLSASRALADFFEAAARAHGTAKSVANWMLRDLLAALKEREIEIEDAAIAPEALARLIEMVDGGRVTAKSARDLVAELTEKGGDPEALVRERGLEAVSDTGLLESVADEVIGANPDVARAYAEGDKKVVNFLMGQVMKKTQGKADPGRVREILARKLEE